MNRGKAKKNTFKTNNDFIVGGFRIVFKRLLIFWQKKDGG